MNTKLPVIVVMSITFFILGIGKLQAQIVNSDNWAVTDALGRKVREYKDDGDKRKDKYVAVFYWTWHQGDDTAFRVKYNYSTYSNYSIIFNY